MGPDSVIPDINLVSLVWFMHGGRWAAHSGGGGCGGTFTVLLCLQPCLAVGGRTRRSHLPTDAQSFSKGATTKARQATLAEKKQRKATAEREREREADMADKTKNDDGDRTDRMRPATAVRLFLSFPPTSSSGGSSSSSNPWHRIRNNETNSSTLCSVV